MNSICDIQSYFNKLISFPTLVLLSFSMHVVRLKLRALVDLITCEYEIQATDQNAFIVCECLPFFGCGSFKILSCMC